MDYYECELPQKLHEFIFTTANHLRNSLLTHPGESFPQPHIVNILWRNPIIGAEVHFTPWSTGAAVSDIAGPNSDYFKKLLHLAPLPVPTSSDLELISEHVARSPQAASAAANLGQDVCKTLRWQFSGVRSFTNAVLRLFCNCVGSDRSMQRKACELISALAAADWLYPLIHILLGVIPQYSFAKGPLSPHLKGWIDPSTKLKAWEDIKEAKDQATALFVLLSTVEALQWRSGHSFYVVPNLFDFLKEKSESDFSALGYLQHLCLALSKLSIYVTAPKPMNKGQENAFENHLFRTLMYWAPVLSTLIRSVSRASLRSSVDAHSELCNWQSLRWARGLIEIASPSEVFFAQEYVDPNDRVKLRGGRIRRMTEEEMVELSRDRTRPGSLMESLIKPWGIYNRINDTAPVAQLPDRLLPQPKYCANDTHFCVASMEADLKMGTGCVLDDSNREFRDAVSNRWLCAGDLLKDVADLVDTHPMQNRDWYKKAFGLYYFHFDQERQKDCGTRDFVIRREREAAFYTSLINNCTSRQDVLDVGIGYGRLQNILLKDDPDLLDRVNFWGLDTSREMKRLYGEFNAKCQLGDRYKIGEMTEVREVFKQGSFDAVIMSYTTFGCYNTDEENRSTLNGIAESLKPGGLLIIEQFNPHLEKPELPFWPAKCVIEDRPVYLDKTTRFLPCGKGYSLYTGEYLYSEHTLRDPRILRRDYYCVRLYSRAWLTEALASAGFDASETKFFADFNIGEEFTGDSKQKLMICMARRAKDKRMTREEAIAVVRAMTSFIEVAWESYDEEMKRVRKRTGINWQAITAENEKLIEAIIRHPVQVDAFQVLREDKSIAPAEAEEVLAMIASYWLWAEGASDDR